MKTKKSANQSAGVSVAPAPVYSPDIVSFDIGNSMFNIRAGSGLCLDIRSEYGPMSESSSFTKPNPLEVVYIGGQWLVFGDSVKTLGSIAEISDYTDSVRYRSSWYRNLITYGLYRAFSSYRQNEEFNPQVVMSIPAGIYRNKDELEAVKTNVTGLHYITTLDNWSYAFNVKRENLLVLPEGAGAFFHSASTDPVKFSKGVWGVMDFGYKTLDVTVYRSMAYIPDSARSNHDVGIWHIADRVYNALGANTEIRLSEVDLAMTGDNLNVNGVDYDITKAKHKILASLGKLASRWSGSVLRPHNVTGVILTGGGSPYYRDYLDYNTLPKKVENAPNPYGSNAEGALLFLDQLTQKEQK